MNKQIKQAKNGTIGRGIEWTDYTWNPIAGCKHGCGWIMPDEDNTVANCYAEDVANKVAQKAYEFGFEHHYWKPQLLSEPAKLKTPSRIFVGSMADVFGHWVPEDQIRAILDVCAANPQHTFQFLTKNAPRLEKFEFPDNCWVGVSSPPSIFMGSELKPKHQINMLHRTFEALGNVKATIRWMSIEPLAFDFVHYIYDEIVNLPMEWVVIGAASNGKKYYQPQREWVADLLWHLDEQSIPVFFKGNLDWSPRRENFPQAGTK